MAIRQLYPFLLVALLSSCALIIDPLENNLPPFQKIEKPTIGTLLVPELANLQTANKKKPVVAIYAGSFTDQTGQRRSNSSYATFSSAVTQAPDAYLIRALKHAGSKHDGFFEAISSGAGRDKKDNYGMLEFTDKSLNINLSGRKSTDKHQIEIDLNSWTSTVHTEGK